MSPSFFESIEVYFSHIMLYLCVATLIIGAIKRMSILFDLMTFPLRLLHDFPLLLYEHIQEPPVYVIGFHEKEEESSQNIIKDCVAGALIVIIIAFDILVVSEKGVSSPFNIFISLYIVIAILILSIMVFHGTSDAALGLLTIIKGFYYVCLAVISLLQYIYLENADIGTLALGLTLTIAEFEAVIGFVDGRKRMALEDQKSKDQLYDD